VQAKKENKKQKNKETKTKNKKTKQNKTKQRQSESTIDYPVVFMCFRLLQILVLFSILRNLNTNSRANVNFAEFTSRATNARDVALGHRICAHR